MITLPDGAFKARNSEGLTWTRIKFPLGERWLMPEDLGYDETIGWACIAWAERWLQLDGKPLQFTAEQERMLLWMHAVRVDGPDPRWVWPITVLVRVKGTGKDLLQAIFDLFELCGPARPVWDEHGGITATEVARPWVIVAATSQDQTGNTSLYFKELLTQEAIDHFGIDLGKEITFTARGGRLESVTSNPKRIEGQRTTGQSGTEVGLWNGSNRGLEMFEAMEGNQNKDPMARIVLSSNAYGVGEGSVLEVLHADYDDEVSGRAPVTINYDSLSAPKTTVVENPASLRAGIDQARGDAWWIDVDKKVNTALAKRTSRERTLRFELNIPAATDDAVYGHEDWDACAVDGLRPLEPGDTITLGLDVSLRDDATGLVAVRVEDRACFLLAMDEKTRADGADWEVDLEFFDEAIAIAFEDFNVVGFYSDVNPVQGHVERWNETYGERLVARFSARSAVAADMRASLQRFTAAHESLMSAVSQRLLKHDGDRDLRRHALNAHRRPNRHGISFGKASKNSPRKVDFYAALLLADLARSDYLYQRPPEEPPKPRRRGVAVSFRR